MADSPVIFEGSDSLSAGIVETMRSPEGVSLVKSSCELSEKERDFLNSWDSDASQLTDVTQEIFDRVLEDYSAISESAKQIILEEHFVDFPFAITTADIGLRRTQLLSANNGAKPHIDQEDFRFGNWLSPDLYTGVSVCLLLRGEAHWKAWPTREFALLDNLGTKDPLPIVRRAQTPEQKNTEVNPDENGVSFGQNVGDLVIVRQGDVIHRVRQVRMGDKPRIRILGDIAITRDEQDLTESEFQAALEWAKEKRRTFFRQLSVSSAVRLEPAQ